MTDKKSYDTTKFREHLSAGTLLLREGKHIQALKELEEAYALDDEQFDVCLNLAGAYILNKKFKKAVAILEPMTETYPDNAEVWQNLGAAYLGNPVLADDEAQLKAVDAFVHALNIKPGTPHCAYNIGLIHKDRKEYQAAFDWFEIAVKTDPTDQHAKYWVVQMADKLDEETAEA